MRARSPVGPLLRGTGLLLLLFIALCSIDSALAGSQLQPKRLIVAYDQSSRAAASYWRTPLENVEVIRHSRVDGLAILSGEPTALAEALARLPGASLVEEDRKVWNLVGGGGSRKLLESAGSKQLLRPIPRDSLQAGCDASCAFKDHPVRPGSRETEAYGISMIGADSSTDVIGPASLIGAGVSVCVIDSGILTSHPDLKGNSFKGCGKGCSDFPYDNPSDSHGTHVVGIIAATRGNNEGTIGVVPSGAEFYGINALPIGGTGYASATMDGLLQCEQHLNELQLKDPSTRMVVQMSFGEYTYSQITSKLFERLYARGDMLFVASAGNDQDSRPGDLQYPAGYAQVISVGAVGCNTTVATFSQRNAKVELVAPGVGVLSSVEPHKLDVTWLLARTAGGAKINFNSTMPVVQSSKGKVAAEVVDCGLAKMPCTSAQGKICLIARGETPYSCKHRSAQLGGCKAMLLYNNQQPPCTPLEEASFTYRLCPLLGDIYLPIATLSLAEGERLLAMVRQGKTTAALTVTAGRKTSWYSKLDGTSMASPHVSGVAARLWAAFPNCRNVDVRAALDKGAIDMSSKGRDEGTGYGLLNAPRSYTALQQMTCASVAPEPAPGPENSPAPGPEGSPSDLVPPSPPPPDETASPSLELPPPPPPEEQPISPPPTEPTPEIPLPIPEGEQ